MNKTVITSFNERGYNLYGREFLNTWLRYGPRDAKLVVYYEGNALDRLAQKHDHAEWRDILEVDGIQQFMAAVCNFPVLCGHMPNGKYEINWDKPQVAYKETIRKKVTQEHKFVRQSGGKGQFAHVWINLEPNEKGKGFVFENKIVGGVMPREYIPAVEKRIEEAMKNGVLAGYPVEDVKARLFDGSYHDVDSSEMAFKIAGSMAFKEAARKASPVLLEPIMDVEVVTPEDYMGDVVGDLNRRRGVIHGMDDTPSGKAISCEVPLAEMFGYATDLRSATQGRATYTMQFEKYSEARASIADAIIKKSSLF